MNVKSERGQAMFILAIVLLILAIALLLIFGTDGLKNLMELSKSMQ